MTLPKKSAIPALTGIRYIAALMVVLNHTVPNTGILWLDSIFKELNVGVTIFFVLSGFLIAYRYFEDYSHSPIWERSYIINRIARIYPMYALVTCFTFLVGLRSFADGNRVFLNEFLLNITLLRGFSGKYIYSGIAQGWTLTVEEVFYLLAPFIFFFSRRIPLLVQASLFLLFGVFFIYFTGLMTLKGMWICTFFGRSFEFMCGIFLYFVIKNNSFRPKIKITWVATLLFTCAIVGMSRLSYPPYEYGIQNPIGLVINNYLTPLTITLLFWALIKERSSLQRLLSTKVFDVLGKSSYTLYLIHYGVYASLIHAYISRNMFVVILILQVSAILAWRFIEEPLNKLIKHVFLAKPRPPVAAIGLSAADDQVLLKTKEA